MKIISNFFMSQLVRKEIIFISEEQSLKELMPMKMKPMELSNIWIQLVCGVLAQTH